MGFALRQEHEYTEIVCGDCGIAFYVNEHWRLDREKTGKNFYCPNGHSRIYRETIEAKLRKELAEKDRALAWEKSRAENLDKRLKTEAKKHQRLQKRVLAGVCPHCQRTFKQLASHMQSKHPEQLTEHGLPLEQPR